MKVIPVILLNMTSLMKKKSLKIFGFETKREFILSKFLKSPFGCILITLEISEKPARLSSLRKISSLLL